MVAEDADAAMSVTSGLQWNVPEQRRGNGARIFRRDVDVDHAECAVTYLCYPCCNRPPQIGDGAHGAEPDEQYADSILKV